MADSILSTKLARGKCERIPLPANRKASVTHLSAWRNRETIDLLRYMTEMLDAERLKGVIVVCLDSDGEKETFVTGAYRRDMHLVVSEGLCMSMAAARGME